MPRQKQKLPLKHIPSLANLSLICANLAKPGSHNREGRWNTEKHKETESKPSSLDMRHCISWVLSTVLSCIVVSCRFQPGCLIPVDDLVKNSPVSLALLPAAPCRCSGRASPSSRRCCWAKHQSTFHNSTEALLRLFSSTELRLNLRFELYLICAWHWLTLQCLRRVDRLWHSVAMRFTLLPLSSLLSRSSYSSLPSSQPGLLLWAGTRCLIKELYILGVCSWSATPHPLAMVVGPQRVHFGSESQQGQGAKCFF